MKPQAHRHAARPDRSRSRTPSLAIRAIIVLALGLALAIPIARAGAQSVDELNQRIAAAQAKAERIAADVDRKVSELASARRRAEAAAAREAELEATLAEARERAARLADELAEAEARLAETRARFRRAQRALSERLVAIYKSNDPAGIDVLLDSEGFDDLATRAELLTRIQEADRALTARVRELRETVAAERDRAAEAKEAADAHTARVAEARREIGAVRAQAEAEASALEQARAAQRAALAELTGNVERWTKQVQRLERISAQEAQQKVAGWFGDWAIPAAIVMCESGGNFSALNPASGAGGAYQILPSTWKAYGGKGLPHQASPAEQHAIAAQIWADSGPSAWVCKG